MTQEIGRADISHLTQEEIELHLDQGLIECEMSNGRWWTVRRNGQTKTWKRNPSKFMIPIKAGFRSCGYISNESISLFRVRSTQS